MSQSEASKTFCRQLKYSRIDQDLSVRDLAYPLGFSTASICFWENDKRDPSLSNFIKWANALGWSVVIEKNGAKIEL